MLPSLKHEPRFELIIPSSKRKIHFRPFLSREHKALLIAKASDEPQQKLLVIKQIIENCVDEKLNINQLPQVDLEYIFLKIRSKSVNNISKIAFRDKDDNKVYSFEIDLDTIEVVEFEGHTNRIEIDKDMGLVMKYPTVQMVERLEGTNEVDLSWDLIRVCIETVYTAEEVYVFADNTREEQDTFIGNLPVSVFEKINEFFQTMPRLQHNLQYTNEKGETKTIALKGLEDFFTFA